MKIENFKTVKEICDLQGITLKFEVMVICPNCNLKTMRIRLNENKVECIKCHEKYDSINEFLRLMQEEYLGKNKGIEYLMKERKGVN